MTIFLTCLPLSFFLAQLENASTRTEVTISKITKARFNSILEEHGFQTMTHDFDMPLDASGSQDSDIPAFQWKVEIDEPGQSQEYLAWLKQHIPLPEHLQYYLSSDAPDLLTTNHATTVFRLKGTTDVAVVSKACV